MLDKLIEYKYNNKQERSNNNMTNFERIKNMTVDELAEELYKEDCNSCPCDKYDYEDCYQDNSISCVKIIKRWLEMDCQKTQF